MCGIIAYLGNKPAHEILIRGLHRLEYRGYDSSGLTVMDDKGINTVRAVGKVDNLSKKVDENWQGETAQQATSGIAHTRWATHGLPTEENAHPHTDNSGKISMVHNGIIENYQQLRSKLESKGYKFHSETDSEVLCNLISELYNDDIEEAVVQALKMVEGTYGIALVCSDEPNRMIAARRGSPIIIGLGEKETIIASDVSALVQYTKQVIYLNDNDIVAIDRDKGVTDIFDITKTPVSREVEEVDWDLGS